jgi:localization factor PodJL
MESATAWKVTGVGRETRVFAEEAARRAGLDLGDWLDEVIAERAAERGVDPADLRRDDRLDAIGERIAGLARRENRFEDDRRVRPRLEPRWSREAPSPREPRRGDDLLEAAIDRLESRAERAEALQAAADRLATVEQRVERALEPRVRDLDARLDALARRVEHEPERRREPPRAAERPRLDQPAAERPRLDQPAAERPRFDSQPAERPRFDPKEAAAQIARRRSELDARASGAEFAPRPRAAEAAAPSGVESLREEIAALTARLEKMRREQAEQSAPAANDVQAVRGELAAMSRSLANLAPRNAVVALEGAMRDLSERVAALGDGGARDALTALIVEAREALRAHDPHAAVAGLERELRTLGAKVDAIAQGVVDPAAFQRIRAQTEEVRNLLAAAAARPVPVERLERQIGELADRVDRLAASPAPQAESARLGALIADARAQIERSIPAAALTAIERRLEDLAQRMDAALRRPPQPSPIDPRVFEDLTRRIDSLRSAVERQPDPAKLEAVLRDIAQRLDRPAAVSGSLEPLTGMVRDLGARLDQRVGPPLDITPLEQALRALGDRPIEIDTAPIEAMMRDLGAKLVPAAAPDMRPFEVMLREISQKLDRGAADAPTGDLAAMIRELGQHIDERVGEPLNTRSLEEALMALRDRLESGPAEQLNLKFIEEVADLLAERLGRRGSAGIDAEALAGQIAAIHDRLDALQGAGSGAALEQRIADLLDELDATRRAMLAPQAPVAGGLADGFAELRAEQEDSDKRTQSRLSNVQEILERLVSRLGRLEDDIARVDEARAPAPAAALPSPGAPPRFADEPFRAVGAASRDLPERSPPLAPPRPLDGAHFLLEPGSTLPRPRATESNDLAPPKSAINAHIAAARRAAQAALAEEAVKPAAPEEEEGESRIAAIGGQAMAFVASRRRPLLLGLALVAAVAMLAMIELRGGHVPLLQTSELSPPAANVAAPLAAAPTPKGSSADLDTTPTGAIPAPTSAAKTPPADLAAAIPADLPQALHDGAAAGNAGAEFELALRLLDGRGVARDPHAAAQWFEQAATRGLPIAEYRLAALYEKGIGVTRDLPAAMGWYVKAATAGNARAMHNLAVMHAEGSIGGKPDYTTAAEWFRKAGQFGVRDSQFNLGILYARGLGVPQDLGQSWLWFSLAAQQGDADAGHKRDDIVAKMDQGAVAAATQALAAFKMSTPAPAANEAPAPASGWDGKAAPQANAKPATAL